MVTNDGFMTKQHMFKSQLPVATVVTCRMCGQEQTEITILLEYYIQTKQASL